MNIDTKYLLEESSKYEQPATIYDDTEYIDAEFREVEPKKKKKSLFSKFFNEICEEFEAKSWFEIIACVSIGFGIFFAAFAFFFPIERTLTVNGFAWEQSVEVQEWQHRRESGWQVPQNAVIVSSEYKKSGSRTDADGYEHAEYAYYYTYDIDAWVTVDTYESSAENKKPYYDTSKVKDLPKDVEAPAVGDKRYVEREGKYYLLCTDNKDKSWKVNVPRELWDEQPQGSKVKLYVNVFGKPLRGQ